MTKWCNRCGEHVSVDSFRVCDPKTGRRDGYCRPCQLSYAREYRYGISAADQAAMLAAQGGKCAICLTADATDLDHDHSTGAVRGFLCGRCNAAIGMFRDDANSLERGAQYLRRAAHAIAA